MRRGEGGRGAAPAGLVATRHSGGIGAPSGATRSPCQELADGSVGAIPCATDPTKAGPGAGKPCDWRGARGPRDPSIASYKICAFRRAIPLILRRAEGPSRRIEVNFVKRRTRKRRGKEPAC